MSLAHNTQVFEGTWEEIIGRAQELAGHRLRVTILPEPVPAPVVAHVSSVNVTPKKSEPQKRNHSLVSMYD